mgnify:CR=1 FL=1
MAEEQTARDVWFITLTYGGGYENPKGSHLHYADLQKTFKRMRRAGHKFRYMAVGEYGSKKDRAHFHALIFWQTEPPLVPMDQRFHWEFWHDQEEDKPIGFVQVEKPRSKQGAAVYLMDYMGKANLADNQMRYSKQPALGSEYLLQKARDAARAGLALFPTGNTYTIQGNVSAKTNKLFFYPIERDCTLYDQMIREYLRTWAEERPNQALSMCDDVSDWLSEMVQDTTRLDPEVQDYIANIYQYEPLFVPRNDHTVYSLDNGMLLTLYADVWSLELRATNGTIAWQKDVQRRGLRPNANLRQDKELLQAIHNEIERAPPRLALVTWRDYGKSD